MIQILAMLLVLLMAAPGNAEEITVSAAASLANAFDEMKQEFEKIHPDVRINTNYAASNPLLRQIIAGAPVDIFASADEATMDRAVEEKVVKPETRASFAKNNLVLIAPKGSHSVTGLQDLLSLGHIAIGNPDSVPAGRYAKESLVRAGLWEKLAPKFIYATSVRQALDYVSRGEVDAGFVYGTDARQQQDRVDVIEIMKNHETVVYPIAVCANGGKAAQEFINFVLSPAGQNILEKYGFAKP